MGINRHCRVNVHCMQTMMLTFVYYFAALHGTAQDRIKSEIKILETSIESLRSLGIRHELVLITNSLFFSYVKEGFFDLAVIDDDISLDNLDHKRVLLQRDMIRDRMGNVGNANLVFVDHDILFSADISAFFAYDFDFGVTCQFGTSFVFDQHYLPMNTGVASINAGVQLCKASQESLAFACRKIEMCTWADANKENIPTPLSASPLSWGCDQISMMLLLNEEIFCRHKTLCNIAGAKVRAFSANILNYTPETGRQYLLSEFRDHMIWHFKGNRKPSMTSFWDSLKSAGII
jgi:hypothetical protein